MASLGGMAAGWFEAVDRVDAVHAKIDQKVNVMKWNSELEAEMDTLRGRLNTLEKQRNSALADVKAVAESIVESSDPTAYMVRNAGVIREALAPFDNSPQPEE